MDSVIYTAMSGAKATMNRQDALAHNLANVSTQGFRADLSAFRAVPLQGGGSPTRVHSVEATAGFDATPGPVIETGRPLDIAVRGSGWIAVQGLDGSEGYTRAGSFEMSPEGTLQTRTGLQVQGDGGPIVVPANSQVLIGSDGTVTAKSPNSRPVPIGRIKLVNPPVGDLHKGADGLVRMRGGEPAPADEAVRVVDGAVEGSNVNVVDAMVGLIAAAREFEMQMKVLQNVENNDQVASGLLSGKG